MTPGKLPGNALAALTTSRSPMASQETPAGGLGFSVPKLRFTTSMP